MSKQPYIPFYVGDYLKDTRVLPLSVRGAWVDLILFMWDAPVRGELIGTMEDFSRMMSCDRSEAEFALNLLKQKSTADFDLLPTGELKITSRKMKRDADISKKRSEVGKKGVEAKFAKGFAEANGQAKVKQNTDNDNDIIVFGIENKYRVSIKKKYIGDQIQIIHNLQDYFMSKGQYEQLVKAKWLRFDDFMSENPGKVFDDDNHLYNSFKMFSTGSNKKSNEKNPYKIQ